MKKYTSHLLIAVFALVVGYISGGLIAAKRASQQAHYSSIMYMAHAKNCLAVGNKEKAEEALSLGIGGSLSVIKTFDEHFLSGILFILPSSGFLLSQKEEERIVKSIDGPSACMIGNDKKPNQPSQP